MAWIIRGNHAYYYKNHRVGATVKSTYYGKGEEAQTIARVDEILKYAARLRAENHAETRAEQHKSKRKQQP
jgi:hypothetical protein